MPRTKLVKNKNRRPANLNMDVDLESLLNSLDMYAKMAKEKLNQDTETRLANLHKHYKALLAAISEKDLHTTLGELRLNWARSQAQTQTSLRPADVSSASRKDDDLPPRARRSRSSSHINNTKGGKSEVMAPPNFRAPRTAARRRSSSVPQARYRTPCSLKQLGPHTKMITPKVTPGTPMAVMRRPRPGEMGMSMSGSPLLMSAFSAQDQVANCNIPLSDGTMLSLMPSQLRASAVHETIPYRFVDEVTLSQLTMIRDNLNVVVGINSKK